jgi:Tfp pilus assembly protein PilX
MNPATRRKRAGKGRLRNPESGFTMAAVLFMLIVLSLLGAWALVAVKGDIRHGGVELKRLKAKVVAESAVNWAQEALANPKYPGLMPFSAATHDSTGNTPLDSAVSGNPNPYYLRSQDMAAVYSGVGITRSSGWIRSATATKSKTLTDNGSEAISVKVWYPNINTVRIIGRGVVEGVQVEVQVSGEID